MKKILCLNTFVIVCSVLGIAGIFLIRRFDPVHIATRDGVAMDTVIRLTAGAPKPKAAIENILEGAFALITDADKKFSMYDPGSEISAINEASGTKQARVSSETFSLLAAALHAAEFTDGAFDPTIGFVTSAWREALEEGRTPSEEEISFALMTVGYDRLRLSAPDSVFLSLEGRLDL